MSELNETEALAAVGPANWRQHDLVQVQQRLLALVREVRDLRAARHALQLAEEHNALLVKERDQALGRLALAKSSLGTIPLSEHTVLVKATGQLVEAVNEMFDAAGHHLTHAMRQQLDRALTAVVKAVGRG